MLELLLLLVAPPSLIPEHEFVLKISKLQEKVACVADIETYKDWRFVVNGCRPEDGVVTLGEEKKLKDLSEYDRGLFILRRMEDLEMELKLFDKRGKGGLKSKELTEIRRKFKDRRLKFAEIFFKENAKDFSAEEINLYLMELRK
jgi:hypothetical protein